MFFFISSSSEELGSFEKKKFWLKAELGFTARSDEIAQSKEMNNSNMKQEIVFCYIITIPQPGFDVNFLETRVV